MIQEIIEVEGIKFEIEVHSGGVRFRGPNDDTFTKWCSLEEAKKGIQTYCAEHSKEAQTLRKFKDILGILPITPCQREGD